MECQGAILEGSMGFYEMGVGFGKEVHGPTFTGPRDWAPRVIDNGLIR